MCESKCISLVLLSVHLLLVLLLSSFLFSLQTATLVFLNYVCMFACKAHSGRWRRYSKACDLKLACEYTWDGLLLTQDLTLTYL